MRPQGGSAAANAEPWYSSRGVRTLAVGPLATVWHTDIDAAEKTRTVRETKDMAVCAE